MGKDRSIISNLYLSSLNHCEMIAFKNLALAIMLFPMFAYSQESSTITPASNLVTQGIPDIPSSIAQQIKKYTEFRTALFAAWHPVKKEMIISTRFGNVPQLHSVKMAMGDRKQLTFYDEPISEATYEPVKGSYFLFTKDVGGNEFSQIYRYEIANGNVTLLTDGKRSQNGGVRWNRKGDIIAYASTSRNGEDRDIYIIDPLQPSSNKMILQVSGGGWAVADWSADGKSLLVQETISINESYLWLVDIATGKKSSITSREVKDIAVAGARFSVDGKGIYFRTDRENEFARLAYMDLSTKKIQYLTSAIPWNVEAFDISANGKQIAFTTNEAGESKLYLLNTSTNKYTLAKGLPTGVYSVPRFHNNNNDVAISINNARSATDVFVYSTTTGASQRWTESELGGLVADELQLPKLIKWKSFDGLEISGFYFKPAAKFTSKRPVIINIHGGPEGQSLPSFQGTNNYYLNELGIAIIYPNVRGSLGYGKTFVKLDNGIKREESVKDIGALIDWIAQQPELDASRIMVTGGSYGGYMTLAVATNYGDKIRCALDIVGISNFNTFLKNTESYRRDLRRVEYGDERDPQIAAYFEKMAPLNNASKIGKPLFIVQGGNDPRVPRTEAVQMVDKVKSNGGTVWYLEAKDEGHGFRKKNNIDFQRYATVLFIQKYLLDGMEDGKKL